MGKQADQKAAVLVLVEMGIPASVTPLGNIKVQLTLEQAELLIAALEG